MALVSVTVGSPEGRQLGQGLSLLKEHYSQKMESGLEQAAQEIYVESQRLVPVDTGALKRSGRIDKIDSGLTTQMQISYGTVGGLEGFELTYAGYVHENLQAYHAPPTQAKYLEQAARTVAPRIPRLVGGKRTPVSVDTTVEYN